VSTVFRRRCAHVLSKNTEVPAASLKDEPFFDEEDDDAMLKDVLGAKYSICTVQAVL